MKHGFIKTAAVTPRVRVADPAYNAGIIIEKFQEAAKEGAKIIVFPELCVTGYTCQDLFLQDSLLRGAEEGLAAVAGATQGTDAVVFVGLALSVDSKLYNVAAAVQNGKILAFIPKIHVPNYAEFYEARYFTPGPESCTHVNWRGQRVPFGSHVLICPDCVAGLKIACEICEDVWAPHTPSTDHAMAGATVIVNLSASDETVGKNDYRETLIVSTSARLSAGYIYASAGEGESTQDLVFGGHNMIAENGIILNQSPRFTCETVYAQLDIQRLCHERRQMNTFRIESGDYLRIPVTMEMTETKLDRQFGCMPFVPSDPATCRERCNEILSIQSFGLKKRLEHTGIANVVLGISGGLDSTLALLVSVRAFDLLGYPRSDIHAVTMPCFGTTDRTYENACRMTRVLGATLREVNIREAVSLHFRDIGQSMDNHDVTFENSQARERTQVLMDIANQVNGLVVGTGDMSELALGWATYNGDHMSMYGVNAGVPKTLVRHLVQYYAESKDISEELKTVLLDVLDTPVSPELLPPVGGELSQKTEDLVGPYELHDFFLYYMLRFGFPPDKIYRMAAASFAGIYADHIIKKWLLIFYKRFFSQQFKRSCLPDGPKVGSVSLSPRGDFRMPSDACGRLWLGEIEKL